MDRGQTKRPIVRTKAAACPPPPPTPTPVYLLTEIRMQLPIRPPSPSPTPSSCSLPPLHAAPPVVDRKQGGVRRLRPHHTEGSQCADCHVVLASPGYATAGIESGFRNRWRRVIGLRHN